MKKLAALAAAVLLTAGLAACDTEVPAEGTAQEETIEAPAKQKKDKTEEKKLTAAQEQAVISAESYLDFAGFSKKGLVDQLKFEDFSEKDAKFAVEYLKPNWKNQAVKSAESYMDLGGFSRGSLVEQLEFEGFTTEQAEHAADVVGL